MVSAWIRDEAVRLREALTQAMVTMGTPGVCGIIQLPHEAGWVMDLWMDHRGERYRVLEVLQQRTERIPADQLTRRLEWALERLTVCALLGDHGGEAEGLEVLARDLSRRGVYVDHLTVVIPGDGRVRICLYRSVAANPMVISVPVRELATPGWQEPVAARFEHWQRMDP